jgi:hypothetical protein
VRSVVVLLASLAVIAVGDPAQAADDATRGTYVSDVGAMECPLGAATLDDCVVVMEIPGPVHEPADAWWRDRVALPGYDRAWLGWLVMPPHWL